MIADKRTLKDVQQGITEEFIVKLLNINSEDREQIFADNYYYYIMVANKNMKIRVRKALINPNEIRDTRKYNLNIILGIPEFKKVYFLNEILNKFNIDFLTPNAKEKFNIRRIEASTGSFWNGAGSNYVYEDAQEKYCGKQLYYLTA